MSYKHSEVSNRKHQACSGEAHGDGEALFNPIGRDMSLNCIIRCPRSNYGALALISRAFRYVFRSGNIYNLRRQMGIAEHWIYVSCNIVSEWMAYDPNLNHWMTMPRLSCGNVFMVTEKESLAVGTDLLLFGREFDDSSCKLFVAVQRYSLLTHSWSPGIVMDTPRCWFGSASLGAKAIVAGGADMKVNVLNVVELYDSEKQTWETLPSMNKPRWKCSGVFMDGKFYVIGGKASHEGEMLTCGEEFDLEKRVWRVIPNMSAGIGSPNGTDYALPLVAVVNNQLYAADCGLEVVKKYDKDNNSWITIGRLPGRSVLLKGMGMAFHGCGERLIVIGGPRVPSRRKIEIYSWIPNDDHPPIWNIIAEKTTGSFVFNSAVMDC